MTNRRRGFSLVEVLVAIVVLAIGILALAQSSGAVTTMIARGKQDTEASLAAQRQLERLRHQAQATTPKCAGLANGSATGPTPGTLVTWTISGGGDSRDVQVTVTYRISRGVRTDTIRTVLGCL